MSLVIPVILCGGSGTRLWPLSRRAFPKQFVPLIDGKSLLSLTLERLKPLTAEHGVTCVGSEEHRFLLRESLEGAGAPVIYRESPLPHAIDPRFLEEVRQWLRSR